MKYIDADLLRKDIEKERKSVEGLFTEGEYIFYEGQDDAYNHTLALIDSLQQDETQIDRMLCSQIWWEEQGWIMIPPDVTIKGVDSLLKQIRKKL